MTTPSRFSVCSHVAVHMCLAASLLMAPLLSHAALVLNNTRVVFNGDKRSTSIVVKNPSGHRYAVQTWINTVADDTTTPVPFALSPLLFKLDPGSEQLVQINALPQQLPNDRESLFFFNMQEIPEASDTPGNQLNIALRTRIKFFYRPAQIKGSSTGQLKSLAFSLIEKNGARWLQVRNPSPFHVTFARLEISGAGQSHVLKNSAMLGPFAEQAYPLDDVEPRTGLQARFSVLNDFGGQTELLTLPISLSE